MTTTWHEDQRFMLPRGGRAEEAFFTYSVTPLQEAERRVVGWSWWLRPANAR